MKADLIVTNIGQLATCASPAGPKRGVEMKGCGLIENAAIAVGDGRIAAVGPVGVIEAEYDSENVIDAAGRAVCPAFVDPHTHIVFAGDRLDEFEHKIKGADYLDILAAGGGIISTVRRTRQAPEDDLVKKALERLDKMLACGTGTVEIKTGYGLDTASELKMLSVIEQLDRRHPIDVVPTFLAAHAIPPEFRDDANSYTDLICSEMLPRAWDWYLDSHFNGRVPFFADVFTEKNAFDLDQSERILRTAKELGFELKAHVDEFTNLGGSRLALELGAVSIDHLDAISDEEVTLLANSGTVGIITPTVNFNFGGTHFADARKLIDAGCAVALSTDHNPGSAPCPSQPMAMAIACRYQKLLPAEALIATTINAAHAIGLGAEVGSLEKGKLANIALLETNDYRQLAYEFGGNLVNAVIIRGRIAHTTDGNINKRL